MAKFKVRFLYDVEFTRYRDIEVEARDEAAAARKARGILDETPHVEWKDTQHEQSHIDRQVSRQTPPRKRKARA